jgi:hypothetical protein
LNFQASLAVLATRHGTPCSTHKSCTQVAALCVVLTLIPAMAGCQRSPSNLTPVEGTIVTKDGQPLPGIEVVFLPEPDTAGRRSSGITDDAGHYHLRTDNGDDGAVAGKYRVILRDVEAAMRHRLGLFGKEPPGEMGKPLGERLKSAATAPHVPPGYGTFRATPLRAEVGHESQTLNFEVP